MSSDKGELLSALLEARGHVEELESKVSDAKMIRDKAEERLRELMELLGEKSFKTEDGVQVVRKETLRASMIKEKKQEVMDWVDEECGRSDLIKKTINAKSFTSFIRKRIENKERVPVDLVKTYFQPTLSITKAK